MPSSDSLLSFASDIIAASPFLEESGIGYRGWGDGFAESLVIEVMEYKRITVSRVAIFAFKMKYIVSSKNIKT